MLVSSVGDYGRSQLLDRWRPSLRGSPEAGAVPTLTLEIIIMSCRSTSTPVVYCTSWQYDGRLSIHLHGSRDCNDEHAWSDFAHAFESRLYSIVEDQVKVKTLADVSVARDVEMVEQGLTFVT